MNYYTMIIPVRCFTCGKVLADKWEAYEKRCKEIDTAEDSNRTGKGVRVGDDGAKTARGHILDELGITQGCCRTVMLTHVDLSLII